MAMERIQSTCSAESSESESFRLAAGCDTWREPPFVCPQFILRLRAREGVMRVGASGLG